MFISMILILLRQKIYALVHKLQCLLFSKHDFKIWKCREIITKQRMPWLSNCLHVVVILIHGCKSCHPHLSCFLRHLNLDLMRSFYIPKKKKRVILRFLLLNNRNMYKSFSKLLPL